MKRFFVVICLFVAQLAIAQGPGCSNVDAGPAQINLDCTTTCTDLTATFLATGETTFYTISPIPYAPPSSFSGLGNQLFLTDDYWSDVITLPFEFCFFGNQQNQLLVGANGVLSFQLAYANSNSAFLFTDILPDNSNQTLAEANIFGAGHDLGPGLNFTNEIGWEIQGTYPCRRFVVAYYNVPHVLCSTILTTQMMVLYEGTNTIEVYIEEKPTCDAWVYGNGIVGIQNDNGTQAFPAPGRNTTNWIGSDEAWRFTPSGSPNYSVTWFDGANLPIGNTSTITVCPAIDETFTVEVEYTNCDGTMFTDSDTIDVVVNTGGSASFAMTATCDGGTANITGDLGGTFVFNPIPTDGATINVTSGTVTNGISGTTYTIEYATTGTCGASSTETVTVLTSGNASFNMTATCDGGTANITGDTGGTFVFNPIPTDGATINATNGTVTNGISGTTYTIEYTSPGVCVASSIETVTVLTAGNASFSMTATCDGGIANVTGDLGGSFAFNPIPTDGATINATSGTITNGISGTTYTIEYTSPGTCGTSSTETVTVLTSGNASFNMTATCDGGTANITGDTGGSFAFNPIPTDGATINATNGTVNNGISGTTYTIEYTTTGTCGTSSMETVTVLTSGNASFGMTATCDGGTANITGDLGGSFAFNPIPTDGATINATNGTVTNGVSGTTYTIEYTTTGTCGASSTETVTVLTTGNASFNMTATCDGGTANIIGDLGGSFAFNPIPTDGATINATSGTVTNGISGTTYTIEYTTTGTCGASSTETVTVLTSGNASFSMAATCDGGTANITGDLGGSFVFNPVPTDGATINATNGTVTNGISGTTYTIEYSSPGACGTNSMETVTVLTTGNASFTMTATCDGGTANITGDLGGSFVFNPVPTDGATINATSGTVTNGVSGTTYTIEYTSPGTCGTGSIETVTVLTSGNASFNMTATCDGGTANITGDLGGTFAFNPIPTDGATINATNGAVTNGVSGTTYTIEYTSPGTCGTSSIETVTVLTTGNASFNMTATCDGGTANITGDTGGTFVFNPIPSDGATINATSGTVTNGISGTTYTIEYTSPGTCGTSSSETVTVLTSGNASFSMAATCDGGTANITGDLGGIFAFNPVPTDGATINATSGTVTNGVSGTTYTIEYTSPGTCGTSSIETVTVLTSGNASFNMTATCDGGTANITGDLGGSFAFNPIPTDGAIINATNGTVTNGISGTTYTIEYTSPGTCGTSSIETVTVLTTGNASFNMTATCDGGTANITGDTGGTFVFNPIPSDGATINATSGTVTNGISGTTYTIEYTSPGTCGTSSIETVTVLTSGNASFNMTATCDGGTANITGDLGGSFVFNPVPTDGATINATNGTVTNGISGTTYTIEYSSPGTCGTSSIETVTVLTTGNASFSMAATCDGGTANITGDLGGSFAFNPIPTDGATINATNGTVTNGISGTTYTIEYATTGTCGTSSTETVTVLTSGNASFNMTATCDGGTANITGDLGGSFIFNPMPTDGATINATNGTVTNGISGTTYTIEYATTGTCGTSSSETVTVLTSGNASFSMTATCDGGTANITGDLGGSFAFNPIPTDGATINATNGTVTNGVSGTTYTIEYTSPGSCGTSSSETVTVLTSGNASFSMTATCDGGSANITGDLGGTFVFNPIPTDSATINATSGTVTNGISGTTYTIEYTSPGTCGTSSSETVTVLTSGNASFNMTATCDGGTANITGDLGGSFIFNPMPTDGATINATNGTVTNGISGTTYTIEYTSPGTCGTSSTETVTVLTSGNASFNMTATCDGGIANITGDLGGSFAFNPIPTDGATINTTSGTVTNGISGTTYTIEYTTTGTCGTSSTETVTVLTSGNASFNMTATCDGGTANITGDLGGSFAFNPIPTDGAIINATNGTVTNGISGTTYTIEYTSPGTCGTSSIETVTVLTTGNASFNMTATCDGGTANITGDTGGTFVFNPIPTDGATINATSGTVTNGISGTTYTIEYTSPGTCGTSSTETVTVLTTGNASFNMSATCDGGTANITGDLGGSFVFNPIPTDGATINATSGTVTNGISGTTYTIEYTSPGTCGTSSMETVTVLTTGNASFTMTATCDGGTANITGDTGGTFVFNPIPTDGATINATNGTVTNGISGTTYTIEYSSPGACGTNSMETVTVLTIGNASFTMTATCDGGTANITGDLGGSFVFNPVPTDGATINATSGTVTNGVSGTTYTIEYTSPGTCGTSSIETVTVLTSGNASFTMTATCDGGTANITGDLGGSFVFNPIPTDGATINATSGTVTNGISGTTYTIEYTSPGTCGTSSMETVTVLTTGNASFTMTATCDGGTANITGDTGGTFVFNPIPTDGATINATNGTVTNGISGTTYTIEYSSPGACGTNSMETVTVLTTGNASFTMTATCDGGTANITGDLGGSFVFNPVPTDGATINATNGTVTNGISGTTYTIEYSSPGACGTNSMETVTVLTTGNASFTMTATCDGGTANITGDLGGSFAFNPIPTDGAIINATNGTVTNGISGTTYTIEYTSPGTCGTSSIETVTVLTTGNASFNMTATCDGGTANITGDLGGSFVFNPVPTDGATINATNGTVTNGISGTTYTIEYSSPGACGTSSIETVTVLTSGNASFNMTATCDGGTANITGDTGGSFVFNPIPTDGATINATSGTVTNGISGTTYTIEYTTTGTCGTSSMETVTVLTSGNASFNMSATCDGGTANITGDLGGTFVFNPIPTDGATINATSGTVTNGISGTTYTIEYATTGTCGASSTETVTVLTSGNASFSMAATCDGGTANITGYTGGTFVFNPIPTDGATINGTNGTVTNGVSGTTYTIEYTSPGVCVASSTETVTVLAAANASFTMSATCDGGTANITGDLGGIFSLNPVPTDGTTIDGATGEVINAIPNTTYSVMYTVSGICNTDFQIVNFTVHPLPILDLEDSFLLCLDSEGNIINQPRIDSDLSIAEYLFEWTEITNPGIVLGTNSYYEPIASGTYNVFVTNATTGCSTVLGDLNTIASVTESVAPSGLNAIITSETFVNENIIEVSVTEALGIIYEFSLDGTVFESNGTNSYVFYNVPSGEHEITAKDEDGCGEVSTTVFIMDYPLFFTPNNDGHNDRWQIIGLGNKVDTKIYIFDRYGRLLKQISANGEGWDGTLNGEPLPSSDYWFTLEYRDPNNALDTSKKVFKAHFTLKR